MSEPYLVQMGRWVADLDYENIPPDSVRAARYQVLNMVAALHGAARSHETASIAAGIGGFSLGQGRSTALATGTRHAPHEAVLSNACYSMAQDFDDIVWMGHTCHSAVFASLAIAEHEGTDTQTFLSAVVAANEIGGRLGASSILGPLNGQMWTFIHLIGASAAAARILRLTAEQATHAMAIALSQPNFALQPGFMVPTSKLLSAALPAATGIQAAYFARAGMTGAPNIIEDRRGFWKRFSYVPLPSMMGGLGDFWVMQTLAVKTVPGCHYFQTACSAIDEIERRRGRIDPKRIRRVKAGTTKLGLEATKFASEYSRSTGTVMPVNVNFDLAVTIAIRLLAGRLTSEQMYPEWLAERTSDIRHLASQTIVTHEPALTLKTIGSLRAAGAGRGALSAITPSDIPRLVRRYSEEYSSTLITPREATGWIKAIASMTRRRSTSAIPKRPSRSSIPLYFPNRVTVEFNDGATETAQVDLPAGSFCSPDMETELKEKFLRETVPVLGPQNAIKAFETGLELESARLPDFIRLVSKQQNSAVT